MLGSVKWLAVPLHPRAQRLTETLAGPNSSNRVLWKSQNSSRAWKAVCTRVCYTIVVDSEQTGYYDVHQVLRHLPCTSGCTSAACTDQCGVTREFPVLPQSSGINTHICLWIYIDVVKGLMVNAMCLLGYTVDSYMFSTAWKVGRLQLLVAWLRVITSAGGLGV
jgi:hypothetical protein